MKIFGAGLSGLIAGSIFTDATIYEAQEKSDGTHKALLRFRTSKVGDALGIKFKKVLVHKGIFYERKFHNPCIANCNSYAQKVAGKIIDRSIWDINSVERYIAPDNFIEQLYKNCEGRIKFSTPVSEEMIKTDFKNEKKISTLPMDVLMFILGNKKPCQFSYQSIKVLCATIPDCDVYQTIYFPDQSYGLYQARITGDKLIAEYSGSGNDNSETEMALAFGIPLSSIEFKKPKFQKYGKIIPIDDQRRKSFIVKMAQEHNIYSLGRFATWKNILLDDVIDDVSVIKKLLNSDEYP